MDDDDGLSHVRRQTLTHVKLFPRRAVNKLKGRTRSSGWGLQGLSGDWQNGFGTAGNDVTDVSNFLRVADVAAAHHRRMPHQLFCRGQRTRQGQAAVGHRLHQRWVAVRQQRLHEVLVESRPVLSEKRFISGADIVFLLIILRDWTCGWRANLRAQHRCPVSLRRRVWR